VAPQDLKEEKERFKQKIAKEAKGWEGRGVR
jgi:hypothetical protein